MGTPSKRRKKNDHQASSQPVRGLDFFFGKQQAARKEQSNNSGVNESSKASDGKGESSSVDGEARGETTNLTDEELARKLQAEFDEQDRLLEANRLAGASNEVVRKQEDHAADREDGGEGGGAGDTPSKEEENSQRMDGSSGDMPIQAKVENAEPAIVEAAPSTNPPTVNPFAAFGKKNTLSLQSAAAEEDSTSYNVPFDQSPLTFDPQQYIPDLKKQWAQQEGGHITYALLTQGFILINSTQSRIKIVDTLVNLLRTIIEGDPDSLLPAVWLATNSIAPPYVDLELGLGGSAISKALKKVCGLDNASLKKLSNRLGDAGDVAFEAKKQQSMTLKKPKPLTIKGVFDGLVKIANTKGHGSVENKQRIVDRLIQDARGAEESRYVVRTLVQHLRIGAVRTTSKSFSLHVTLPGPRSQKTNSSSYSDHCVIESIPDVKTARCRLPNQATDRSCQAE
jgi:DNA ligase-1